MTAWWRFKGLVMRLLSPLFFQRIGAGTMFTGRIRLPMPLRKITIGRQCMIGHDVFFQTGRTSAITIGDNVSINSGCHLVAGASITIGNNTAIGEYSSIRDQDHRHTPGAGVRGQGFVTAPVSVGQNCWIGRGVHISPGSVIGDGSIVAANSVVKGQFPPNVLLAGAPARIKRALLADGSALAWDGEGSRPVAAEG